MSADKNDKAPVGSKGQGPKSKAPKTSPEVPQPTPDNTYDSAPVRHFGSGPNSCWIVATDDRERFLATFCGGLMTSPVFNGKATPMHCGTRRSTGEATGKLVTRNSGPLFHMPTEAKYVAPLGFNVEKGAFVIKGTEFQVTGCDYLLMRSNGSSQFGWKERPVGAPDIAAA